MNDQKDRVPLDSLDPGVSDPGFWVRFHSRVMDESRGELARRQLAGDLGIAEVVFAWRKTLVPMSLMAAALAAMLLVSHHEPTTMAALPPLAVEEALVEDLTVDPIPTVLGREAELDEVAFLSFPGRL